MSKEIKADNDVIVQSWDKKHTIQFRPTSHRYKLDGKPVVGATTFTKASLPTSIGLINWMKGQTAKYLFETLSLRDGELYVPSPIAWPLTEDARKELYKAATVAHEEVAREAADIGTIVHAFAELHSNDKFAEAEALLAKVKGVTQWPVIESCIAKYLEWDKTNHSEIVFTEHLIGSPAHHYCGTLDRLDRVAGKLRIRDYKTSKSIYLDQFVQFAVYDIGLKEWDNIQVDGLEAVRFGKEDGSFEALLIDDPKELQVFREQAIRCRETYEFLRMNSDPRFDWRKK